MVIKIKYPTKHSWRTYFHENSSLESFFGISNLNKIINSIKQLEDAGYYFQFHNLNELFLKEFEQKYIANLINKKSPKILNFREIYKDQFNDLGALSLYSKNKELIGAYLIRIYNGVITNIINFPAKVDIKIEASNISFLFTYLLYKKAVEENLDYFSYGNDRNPYGVFADAGLAIFKLRCGSRPFVSTKDDLTFNEEFEWDEKTEVILMSGDEKGEPIKKCYLFTTLSELEIKSRYGILFKPQPFKLEIVRFTT